MYVGLKQYLKAIIDSFLHRYPPPPPHTHTHTHAHTRALACTRTYTYTRTRTHTHTHTHSTHAHTRTHTHTHMCTHTRTHTHMYTHMECYSCQNYRNVLCRNTATQQDHSVVRFIARACCAEFLTYRISIYTYLTTACAARNFTAYLTYVIVTLPNNIKQILPTYVYSALHREYATVLELACLLSDHRYQHGLF